MKQRAPYKLEVFDDELWEPYGTISAVDTLAGASLQFIGWDALGNVIWNTDDQTGITATVTVTDPVACTYAATVGPLPAEYNPFAEKVYSWKIKRTSGTPATLVWGFVTVTPTPPDNN